MGKRANIFVYSYNMPRLKLKKQSLLIIPDKRLNLAVESSQKTQKSTLETGKSELKNAQTYGTFRENFP